MTFDEVKRFSRWMLTSCNLLINSHNALQENVTSQFSLFKISWVTHVLGTFAEEFSTALPSIRSILKRVSGLTFPWLTLPKVHSNISYSRPTRKTEPTFVACLTSTGLTFDKDERDPPYSLWELKQSATFVAPSLSDSKILVNPQEMYPMRSLIEPGPGINRPLWELQPLRYKAIRD